jgi:uracil-DNA glycosylase family 4
MLDLLTGLNDECCEKCGLCKEQLEHPRLPTRLADVPQPEKSDTALVIVGEAPGYNEDKQGTSWVGWAGQLLHKFLNGCQYHTHVAVYLANSCRCFPMTRGTPSPAEAKCCRPNLVADIQTLHREYKNIVVFCLGAVAVRSVLGCRSLNMALSRQGTEIEMGGVQVHVFSSYHPALLHPGRQPAKIKAVETHFILVGRYLSGDFIPNSIKTTPVIGQDPPERLPDQVGLDIETYGVLQGVEQTVFNPARSMYVDEQPLRGLIQTVTFGYVENNQCKTYLYTWPEHKKLIIQWVKRCAKEKKTIIGQNIKFDVMYLRAADMEIAYWLHPAQGVRLDDTMLAAFLLYEQQPEKGLKELAKLYGLADYERLLVTRRTHTATSRFDKDLWIYNSLDVAVTLELYRVLWERIREVYGEGNPKLSPLCTYMRNAILWTTIDLESAGCCFDIPKLTAIHDKTSGQIDRLTKEAAACGLVLSGTGSDKSKMKMMLKALEATGMIHSPDIERTEKKKEVSLGKANMELVLSYLDETSEFFEPFSLMQEYETLSKLVTSYTEPILHDARKGICKVEGKRGMAWPTWYPLPSQSGKGAEDEGGTIQGRYSAKKPAVQTLPSQVEHCITSRFVGGKIKGYDESQMELRIAAFLSKDPALQAAFQPPEKDLHILTAIMLDPTVAPDRSVPAFEELRSAAKVLNFLVLYRGGAEKFKNQARKMVKLDLAYEFCDTAIRKWYAGHQRFKEWQDGLLSGVKSVGYMMLPTGWSRTFAKGQAGIDSYYNEICNFPIQTISAQLLISAHYSAMIQFYLSGLRSRIVRQIHDALEVDIYPGEEEQVDAIVGECLLHPPILLELERVFASHINLKWGVK